MRKPKPISEISDSAIKDKKAALQVTDRSTTTDITEEKRAKLIKALQEEMDIITAKKPVSLEDTEEVIKRVGEFIERASERKRMVTVSSLAVALGMDGNTVNDWLVTYPDHPTCKFLAKMKSVIVENMEVAALQNTTNNVTSIFLLKATAGYREAPQEHIITNGNELGTTKTNEQLNTSFNEFIDAEFSEVEDVEG